MGLADKENKTPPDPTLIASTDLTKVHVISNICCQVIHIPNFLIHQILN